MSFAVIRLGDFQRIISIFAFIVAQDGHINIRIASFRQRNHSEQTMRHAVMCTFSSSSPLIEIDVRKDKSLSRPRRKPHLLTQLMHAYEYERSANFMQIRFAFTVLQCLDALTHFNPF